MFSLITLRHAMRVDAMPHVASVVYDKMLASMLCCASDCHMLMIFAAACRYAPRYIEKVIDTHIDAILSAHCFTPAYASAQRVACRLRYCSFYATPPRHAG